MYKKEKSYIIFNENIRFKKIYNYIDLNNKGAEFILNRKYNEALEKYEEALYLSEILEDEYKINESKCNIGITYFFIGRIDKALKNINICYNYINTICSLKTGKNTLENLFLYIKSNANLCMLELTLDSKNRNCISYINDIMDMLLEEKDISKQLFCIKYLNNILFKVNSLLNNNDYSNISKDYSYNLYNNNFYFSYLGKDFSSYLYNSEEQEYNNIVYLFTKAFNNFMETKSLEEWLKSLYIINEKMRKLKNKSGLIYIIFNLEIAKYLNCKNDTNENKKEVNNIKIQLIEILETIKKINNNNTKSIINTDDVKIDENYLNDVFDDYISKILIINEIYKMLYSYENKLTYYIQYNDDESNYIIYNKKNYNENDFIFNINSEFYIIFLFKYAINYFNKNLNDIKFKKGLIKQMLNIIQSIKTKKIDISQIDISLIDPEISFSLKTIINNLFKIYYKYHNSKSILKRYLYKYRYYTNIFYLKNQYTFMAQGQNIKKYNFNKNLFEQFFYQIHKNNDVLLCFSSKDVKKLKNSYDLDKILNVFIGEKTKYVVDEEMLKKEIRKKPYLFLCLILKTKGKKICLYFNKEHEVKRWFYGLFYYYNFIGKNNYKICSCTSYILYRIKCIMINKLYKNINSINNISFCSCLNDYYERFL